MQVTKRDLRLLKDEGLIHFRWHLPDRGTGRLSSLAFDAVDTNFHEPAAGDGAGEGAGGGGGAAGGGEKAAAGDASERARAVVADKDAIALRFEKITAELV